MGRFEPNVAAIDRLREAIEISDKAMIVLTEKIRRLNIGLLWMTIAILLLTLMQVLVGLGVIHP